MAHHRACSRAVPGAAKPKVLPTIGAVFVSPYASIQVVRTAEDINAARPPRGQVLPAQPKMRIQGLNPTWTMDWPGFITELEAAAKRRNEKIPVEAQVKIEDITEETGEPMVAAQPTGE